MTDIKSIIAEHELYITNKEQLVCQGWAKTIRLAKKGSIAFIELYDGSTLERLKCVYEGVLSPDITYMSSVRLTGSLVESPAKGQKYELSCSSVELIGTCSTDDYPLPRMKLSFEHLRKFPHLRMRTDTTTAIMRVRHSLIQAIHRFYDEQGYINIHTPIITGSDCEGAGEAFGVGTPPPSQADSKEFFPSPGFLTVSGQLQGETAAMALGKIYTFGPTFRAEKSQTSRHLSEFWMIEPETAFMEFPELIQSAKDLLIFCVTYCVERCGKELEILDKIYPGLIQKLTDFKDFKVVTYTQAIEDIEPFSDKFSVTPYWGIDLGSEHERFLVEELYKLPTIITDYPKDIKAFYMHENDDGKTVSAMDVLLPGIGEVIGGSQREIRYDVLKEKMDKLGLDYQWYLDLRKYGSAPHSGFGLGFDRMLRFITGIENIRDVVPFPVAYGLLTC